MNYKFILGVLTVASLGVSAAFYFEKPLNEREKFSRYLKEHPFNNRQHIEIANDDENETDRPDLAWEQDFMRTLNPTLGRPTPEVLPAIIQQIRSTPTRITMSIPGDGSSPWVERGPNNIG